MKSLTKLSHIKKSINRIPFEKHTMKGEHLHTGQAWWLLLPSNASHQLVIAEKDLG